MTKIGEGKFCPQPSDETYHKQLQYNLLRFENALSGLQVSKNNQETAQLQEIMNQQMKLIVSNIREIKLLGIQKQGEKVQADFKRYAQEPTPENLTTLQQELSTLEQYNIESVRNSSK